ncbi:hypothetical protein B0H10DRAFT_1949113 [Mycena sp. CBHHK59/15]|nr:hypothetical protein B0H10DRAFT_1949113 [Mycena sp. CBHHK59/15]
MTVLLTGGTGKSATPLANLLLQANQRVILATRSGKVPEPFTGTQFDWLDASTYNIPFETDANIDRIYLIPPPVMDMFSPMKSFIDFAITKGVKRFVLMSAALLEKGGPAMGQVHEYLSTLNVEYCAIRPSFFFAPSSDNFLMKAFSERIKVNNDIVSAAADGQIGWVSTEDIADVAFKALVDDKIQHTNPIIVGPELLSYDKIAAMLSEAVGRTITHTRLTEEEFTEVEISERGMSEAYARMMSSMDIFISKGAEERLFHRADVIGKRTMRDFIQANKDAWVTSN